MKIRLLILFLFIGIGFTGFAQNRIATPGDEPAKFIKSYPNPASSFVNFEFLRSVDKTYYIEIYNFMGKKVLDIRDLNQRISVPLTNFYRGLYFYKLCDKNNRIIENGRFQVVK